MWTITQEGQYLDLYSLDYYPPERTLNNVLSVAKGEFNSNGAVIEMSFISTNDISEAQEIMEEQIGSPRVSVNSSVLLFLLTFIFNSSPIL